MDSDKDKKQPEEQAQDTAKQPEQLSDLVSEDSPTSEDIPPQVEQTQTANKRLLVIKAVVAGVIVLLAIGFFLSQRGSILKPQKSPEPTTIPSPAGEPTVTPKPTFDRSEWSLEVLNGSGVTGAAKKLADKLESLGYKILKTGNADRSDYKVSALFVSKDSKDKQDLLLEDLKKEVDIASVSGELKNSTASARIIIGKE